MSFNWLFAWQLELKSFFILKYSMNIELVLTRFYRIKKDILLLSLMKHAYADSIKSLPIISYKELF